MVKLVVALALLVAVAALLLVPFHPEAGLLNLMHALTPNTAAARSVDWFVVESGGNFVVFALVGIAAFVVTRRAIAAAAVGCLLSAVAEAAQLVIPSRVASWTDLLTNCLGTIAGVALAVLVARFGARHRHSSHAATRA